MIHASLGDNNAFELAIGRDGIDEVFGRDETVGAITSGRYDLVGVTAYTSGATRAYELAGLCREKGIVVGLMTEWTRGEKVERRSAGDNLGGTMRLGAYEAHLTPESKVAEIYGSLRISERHRHRYEVNNDYRRILQENGMILSGVSPDGNLVEMIEIENHPFFVGCQFHPELKSRIVQPHPLFISFVKAALEHCTS